MFYVWLWLLLIDLPLAILRVLVAIVGPLVVLIALPFARPARHHGNPEFPGWEMMRLPRLFAPWDNPDYGTMGNRAYGTSKAYNPFFHGNPTGFWSQWYWLAIRNPANGLTRMRLFSCVQGACDYVRYEGKKVVDNGRYGQQTVWAKDGWRLFTGFYAMVPYCPWFDFELRIGFKLLPGDPERERPVGMTFIINPFKRAARR